MRKIIYKLERWLIKKRSECAFDTEVQEQVILLAGLGGYPRFLYPLVRFLRRNGYAATAVPEGLNLLTLNTTVAGVIGYVDEKLLQKGKITKVTFFGHSFGGRVACITAHEIKKLYPDIVCEVITAGSPLSSLKPKVKLKPYHVQWYIDVWFRLVFLGYREWKPIVQPDPATTKFIGFYSLDDELVNPHYARQDYKGELIELSGFTHVDLLSPQKIGGRLLRVLES
ncbi:MAG: hypothetical protein V4665_03065 [Patescibacteria group bacterium]